MTTTAQPQPSIQGDYNQISILYQLTNARSEDFFRPNLDDYRLPRFPRLKLTGRLIGQLRRGRLLLLTGDPAIDKHEIARYLASYLCDLLTREAVSASGSVVDYQEWSGLSGQHIDAILAGYTAPTVFILPKLHPQHIDYNYHKLLRVLGSNHYAIASIDYAHPWQQWASEDSALASYLHCLTLAETYPPRFLADFFEAFVGESQIDPRRFRTGTDGRPCIASQSIEQIAEQLHTPRRVREFVRQLSELPPTGLFTTQHLTEALKATHSGNTLRSWYQKLDEQRHHHLLALAIYLFDGLAETQFFAAVDLAIAQAWRQRDPWLRSLDYKDLAYLEHFFQFVPTKHGKRILRTRSPEERRMLLDIVWDEQRRSIASTLPIFYDYISQSQMPQPYSELYGTQERCAQLRLTLTETISELGLRDVSDVELLLLQLGSDTQIGVQAVAARVIARWYEVGEQQRALGLLRHWVDGYSNRELAAINSAANDRTSGARSSNLRKTAALAIAYAAQSDARKHLSRPLHDMLMQLAQDSDDSVVGYIARYTLPMLWQMHLPQLQQVMLRVLRNITWQATVISLMIDAYRRQPTLIQRVLQRWFETYLHAQVRSSNGPRQAIWAAAFRGICAIYQRLPYGEIQGGVPVEVMIKYMLDVLSDEFTPADVREIALGAVLDQSQSHYRYLRHFIPPATAGERKQIVRTLLALHREQLAQSVQAAPAGVSSLLGQGSIPNATPLEQEVLHWVVVAPDAVEQQIAIQVAMAFIVERYSNVLRGPNERRQHILVASRQSSPERVGLYPLNWYLYSVVAPLVTMRAQHLRSLVRHVLPVIAEQRSRDPDLVDKTLHAWAHDGEPKVTELATCLRRANRLLWLGRPFI